MRIYTWRHENGPQTRHERRSPARPAGSRRPHAAERTVGEIVEFFDLSQPTISRHLQTLTAAGLVKRRKRAQRVYYGINSDSVREVCISLAACFPCCCQEIGDGSVGVQAIVVKSPARERKSSRRRTKKPKPGGKDR
jgi:DNA-binding transcriptional ArsR family regulator